MLALLVNVQIRFKLPKQFATDCDSYNNSMKIVKSQCNKNFTHLEFAQSYAKIIR